MNPTVTKKSMSKLVCHQFDQVSEQDPVVPNTPALLYYCRCCIGADLIFVYTRHSLKTVRGFCSENKPLRCPPIKTSSSAFNLPNNGFSGQEIETRLRELEGCVMAEFHFWLSVYVFWAHWSKTPCCSLWHALFYRWSVKEKYMLIIFEYIKLIEFSSI